MLKLQPSINKVYSLLFCDCSLTYGTTVVDLISGEGYFKDILFLVLLALFRKENG